MTAWAADAKIAHPSMLFTPARVSQAKQALSTDSARIAAWQTIKAEADRQVDKGADVRKLEYLALAYQLTGDKHYSDRLKESLLRTSEIESWHDKEMMARKPQWRSELQMAHKAFQLAVAYDAVYNDLSASERKKIARGLWRLAGEPLLGDWLLDDTRIHSLNSMGHNWWSSCLGMGSLLALAISNEIPEAAEAARKGVESLPEWFDFAGDVIQKKPRTFDPEGGMYESINYASFGVSEALLLRLAWMNSHPGEKLEDIPQMEKLGSFFSQVSYPSKKMLCSINFGDSHKNVTGERSLLLARAMGVDDPAILWYVDQVEPGQFREGMPLHFPMGFLYMPYGEEPPAEPALPKSHIWKDFGWATMRDSWQPDATMLAVKSGMTWNHSHADANSMILFHKGHDLIKDAGNCSYGKPEYRNYFFQTDAHNVVKFNGKGQSAYQQYHGSPLKGTVGNLLDAGSVKYVLCDGTGPMSEHLSRNYRHYLWIDNTIFVVDDLLSHEPGQWEWLWHPGGKAVKRGYDLEITEGDASLTLRPLYPAPLAPSNYVHDYPENLTWEILTGPTENLDATEEYYSFRYPKTTDQVKGVTAILLKDSANQNQLPEIERRQGNDWIGLRITSGDKITDLYINQLADGRLMHLNSWITADGWETDAYMLAVTYEKGKDPKQPERMFIGHGSLLRHDGKTDFSSLSKLNAVAEKDGTDLHVTAEGQPRINFRLKAKPKALTVNGQTKRPEYDKNGILTIKTTSK